MPINKQATNSLLIEHAPSLLNFWFCTSTKIDTFHKMPSSNTKEQLRLTYMLVDYCEIRFRDPLHLLDDVS